MIRRLFWGALLAAAPLAAGMAVRSDFEGGSIGRVQVAGPRHLICSVKGEVDHEKRNRQASWYYFRIDGTPRKEIVVDLTDLPGEYNYLPGNLAINGRTRPFVSYDRRVWIPLPDSAVEWDASLPRLRFHFTPERSPVWIAHVPPYTTQDLARLLDHVKLDQGKKAPRAVVRSVGKSAGGRDLYLLTITNRTVPDGKKRVLWLMARQHAWESGTSWLVEGAVRWLLRDDPDAARLRDAFLFQFFPMADPDGVARGGVRFNAHGYDVNRNWDVAGPQLMPEIAALRRAVLEWVDAGHPIDLFLSLHNDNQDYLQGPLSAAGPAYRSLIGRFAALLAKETIFEGKAPRDWPKGEIPRGRKDACQGLFADRGIATLLLEQSVQTNSRLGHPPGVKDYLQFGEKLPAAMATAVGAER